MIKVKFISNELKIKPFGNPDFDKLLPEFNKESCQFLIEGINCPIATALRQIIVNKIPCKCMSVISYKTNDSYIDTLYDNIYRRIQMIPLMQDTPINAKFKLNVSNKTNKSMEVFSSEIKNEDSKNKQVLFEPRILICELQPQCNLQMEIGVMSGEKDGWFILATNVAAVPTDEDPSKVPSSLSEAKNYKISYITKSTMDGRKIAGLACDILIKKCQSAKNGELIEGIEFSTYKIFGADESMGLMINYIILELHKNEIGFITCDSPVYDPDIIIKIKSNQDPKVLIHEALDKIIGMIKQIRSQL